MTITEINRTFDISLRNLQWWRETDLIRTTFQKGPGPGGFICVYDPNEVRLICAVNQLRRRGITMPRIRHISRRLRFPKTKLAVTDFGRRFIWCADDASVIEAMKIAKTEVWLIDTDPIGTQ